MVGPARKREAVAHVCQRLEASERRACRTLGQARSSQRYHAKPREDDARLDDTLNTTTCTTCGDPVTADVPIWLNMEAHGLEPLFYLPLEYLENGYLAPATLSDPVNTNQVFYSRSELARQVRARILIHRLPIGV